MTNKTVAPELFGEWITDVFISFWLLLWTFSEHGTSLIYITNKQTNKQNVMMSSIYNHGQKSWDKFTFVALFLTLHFFSPSPHPPPPYNVGYVYTLFLQSFNIVLGGEGGKQRILQRGTVLF